MCFPLGEDGSDPVSDLISTEEFSNGFKLLSEDLSSSLSGCHIGHYKEGLGDEEPVQCMQLSYHFPLSMDLHCTSGHQQSK